MHILRIWQLLLLCCLYGGALAAQAAAPLSLHADTERYVSYPALDYFCLPEAQAPDHQQVLSSPAAWPWQAVGAQTPNRGFSREICWFQLKLYNQDSPLQNWFLVVNYALLEELDVYILDAQNAPVASYISGNNRRYTSRPYPSSAFAFPVRLAPTESLTALIRVHSPSLQLPLEVVSARRFANQALVSMLLQGLFFGGMIVMILYNFFLYLAIREPAYLLYVLSSIVITLIQSENQGLSQRFLWPDALFVLPYLLPLATILLAAFTCRFLDLARRAPRWAYLLYAHIALGALLLLLAPFVDRFYLTPLQVLLFLILEVFILLTAVQRMLAGDPDARLFTLAWICFITGAAILILNKFNVLPHTPLTENLAQLGSFLEVVLMSFAMAYRINRLKAGKDAAELTALTAETRDQAKSEFLATMSHEIRTPLNGVLGLTELLRHTPLNAQQGQYVDTICRSSNTLLTVINDVLDYSRIEAGQLKLEPVDFLLDDMVDECVSLFAARAVEQGLPLWTLIAPDVPAVLHSDPIRLKQILNNLLSNALKFTDQGSISLHVQCQQQDERAWLEFTVEDSGIGLSPEQQGRLFHAFHQADHGSTRRYGGSGLGLSISKRLCELLGGDIGVHSESGLGSRFWFRVPVTVVQQDSAAPQNKELLIVSTQPLLHSSIRQLALRWGLRTHSVSTPAQAASHYQASPPQGPHAMVFGAEHARALPDFSAPQRTLLLLQEPGHALPPRTSHDWLWLELPLRVQQLHAALNSSTPEPREEDLTPPPELATLRVLVAEDNTVNQLVICHVLRSLGIEPLVVDNGLAALDAMAAQTVDVLLMDCEMPVMDGYEATRRIRAREHSLRRPASWIIGLSAHAEPRYVEKAQQAGVNDYLSKPFKRQQIMNALLRALRQVATNAP